MRCFAFFVSVIAWGGGVEQAAARVEELAGKSSPTLRIEFRMLAAQVLKDRHPELAAKFVRSTLEDLGSRDDIGPGVLRALAAVAPEETLAIYRSSLGKGQPKVDSAAAVVGALIKEHPIEAANLFRDILTAFSFEAANPYDLYRLIGCATMIASTAPGLAAGAYERIVTTASKPDYGKDLKPVLSATFQSGETTIATTNSRDTLLVSVGARLRDLAPERFEKRKAVFAQWDLTGRIGLKGLSMGAPNGPGR